MTDQELKLAREKYLREDVEFYNSSNRGICKFGGCQYSPTPASPGCSIGRRLPRETIAQIVKNRDDIQYVDFIIAKYGLPDDLRVLGISFLESAQRNHDKPHNWDESGLADTTDILAICDKFGLDIGNIIVPRETSNT